MAKAKKESEERQKQKVASIQAYYKELAAMAALVKEPGQLSEKKCDESVVAKRTKEHSFGGRLLTVAGGKCNGKEQRERVRKGSPESNGCLKGMIGHSLAIRFFVSMAARGRVSDAREVLALRLFA